MDNSGISGLDAFLKYLDDSPKKMQQGVHVGLFAGAQLIEAAAKANCSVGPPNSENVRLYGDYMGALRDSIRATVSEKDGKVFASVKAGGKMPNGAEVYYAHLIEFTGAAPHVIRGKNGPISFGGKTYDSINHPGMQAKPFLRPALDANEVAAIGLLDKEIESVINK